jgi:hypothetical protein
VVNEELKELLEEGEATLGAIPPGDTDAVMMTNPSDNTIFVSSRALIVRTRA